MKRSLGRYPIDTCNQYFEILRDQGIITEIVGPALELPAQVTGVIQYGEILVDEEYLDEAVPIIQAFEKEARERVRVLVKKDLPRELFHTFFYVGGAVFLGLALLEGTSLKALVYGFSGIVLLLLARKKLFGQKSG
jgi:hypothetical protein